MGAHQHLIAQAEVHVLMEYAIVTMVILAYFVKLKFLIATAHYPPILLFVVVMVHAQALTIVCATHRTLEQIASK